MINLDSRTAKCLFTMLVIPGIFTLKSSSHGELLPVDRRIEWSVAGIPGGIPSRTVIFTRIDAAAFGNGTTDATAAIQNAINACPDNQVVYLPGGRYKTTQTIHLYDRKTLRGAGAGKTIVSFESGWGRSIVDMRGSFYWDVTGLQRSFDIIGGGTKGSTQIVLGNAGAIAVGDILLIDQLNDPQLVDPVGYEGLCTYCGRANGTRARGQIVEVTAINGNTVSVNLPLYFPLNGSQSPQATLVNANSMVRWAGIEDLTITEPEAVVDYLIEMDGAQYCWVKNVEVERVNQRGLWLIESLQNEIRDSYFHDAINGFGRSYGYGILVDMYSSANRIENNILRTLDGGFLMAAGGASGNVFGYNYMIDSRFDDSWWLTASPAINHAPHPSMNLWEGNIGVQASADCIHGSSSHNTLFRCRFTGWQSSTITSNNNAIEFQYKNTNMNVVCCVLGTPGQSDTYESAYPASGDNARKNIWRLGYGGPSWAGDLNVKATLLRHANFDYATYGIDNDPRITDTNLPPSLYLSSVPSWWGNLPWPPIGSDVIGLTNKIPAQIRFEQSNPTGVSEYPAHLLSGSQPSRCVLFQNYPNPFNPTTIVLYQLPEVSNVKITMYDILGREVSVLVNQRQEAGIHKIRLSANGAGARQGSAGWSRSSTFNIEALGLASGVYFCRLEAGGIAQTIKLLVSK